MIAEPGDAAQRAAVNAILDRWRGRPLRQLRALLEMGPPDELRGAMCEAKVEGRQAEGAPDPLRSTSAERWARAEALGMWDAMGKMIGGSKS